MPAMAMVAEEVNFDNDKSIGVILKLVEVRMKVGLLLLKHNSTGITSITGIIQPASHPLLFYPNNKFVPF